MKHLSSITSLPVAVAAFGVAITAIVPAAEAHSGTVTPAGISTHQNPGNRAWDAQDRVNDSVRIVDQMRQNPKLASLLERAAGVFVIPHYGEGGFIIGGQGGGGVVLAKHRGIWGDPAFFSIAGGSIGAQAGGEGGSIVMLLMSQKALNRFAHSNSTWALNGNAGLTVATWSDRAQAKTGHSDVIIWANTTGLYGGLTASVTDVMPDNRMDRTYYGQSLTAHQILTGTALTSKADPLRNALSARVASR